MINELKKIIDVSRNIGKCPDLVQGAGGNISVKDENGKMLIKASGWRLSDINENEGLVKVNCKNINANCDFSRYSGSRPSIETGFHILLDKYVIHTHPACANIISCSLKGEQLMKEIFRNIDIEPIWLQYANPGLDLALAMGKKINEYKKRHGKLPEVVLMQNHGLVVSGNDINRVSQLQVGVVKLIRDYLKLEEYFPQVKISQTQKNEFRSGTEYLKEFIRNNYQLVKNISENILFPDLAVFCPGLDKKVVINETTGEILYKTNQKESLAMEENLTAWAYIVDCAKNCGLNLNFISQDDINYINNMESEKFRKKMVKKRDAQQSS